MRAHTALPNFKDGKGMRKIEARLIKKAVPEAAAQNDAENAVKKKILNILFRNAAPGFARPDAAKHPKEGKAHEIHQAVPANSQRAKMKSDGIEFRMNQHKRRAFCRKPGEATL